MDDAVETDAGLGILQDFQAARQIGLGHGEGDVRLALFAADVLDDHVDVDRRIGQRLEDGGDGARLVGHAGQDDLRLILVIGDAGDELAFHVMFLDFGVADDHRSGGRRLPGFDEAGKDLNAHAHLHGEADRTGLQHLGPDGGEFEHLLIGHEVELAGAGDDAGVGGVDAVDIGIDVTAVGADRGGDGNRAGIRPATAQRRDPACGHHPLKAGNDRDLARRHRGKQRLALDVDDPGLGVGFLGLDRQLPAQPAARRHAHRL